MRVGGEDSHLKARLPDCVNGETKKAGLVIPRQGKCLTWSSNPQQGTFQVHGSFHTYFPPFQGDIYARLIFFHSFNASTDRLHCTVSYAWMLFLSHAHGEDKKPIYE